MEKETNIFKVAIGIFIVSIITLSASFILFSPKSLENKEKIKTLSSAKSKIENEIQEINKIKDEKTKRIQELKAKLGN